MVKCLIKKNENIGLLILRVTLGVLFIFGGISKFLPQIGPASIQGFADAMLGGSLVLAILVGLSELLGGIAILTGIMARQAGVLLSIVMLGAIILVHFPSGNMLNVLIHFVLIGALLNITFSGSGCFSACKKE